MLNQENYCSYRIFILIGILFFPLQSYAVPAAPEYYTLDQPDGSKFKARQWGDENLHGWETEDGYSIVFDSKIKGWAYAVHGADDDLESSSKAVGKGIPKGVTKHMRPKGKALSRISHKQHSKELKSSVSGLLPEAAPATVPEMVVPLSWTANIPVILVNFNNTLTMYTTADFMYLLFGTGNKSMKDYYQEVSYGAFTVSPGPGGVVGWYTASNTHDYYGKNVSGSDAWPGDLVYEAVAAADAAGFNFAPYDQDGDCYVEGVNIVHQGTGEEAYPGSSTDIWSHRWSLSGALYWKNSHYGVYTTNDPCSKGGVIKVDDYVIQPEILYGKQQTIGVFAHEYGHVLGLPDLYDADYSSAGIGKWSLMAAGSWNKVINSGDSPAHMDAWSKYSLGWVAPTHVSETLFNQSVAPAATSADVYQLLTGSPSSGGEYFLVENRQKTGFDAGLPDPGLLIWHIDESKTSNSKECYPGGPSCATQHYHVALVQADNLWELEKNIDRGDSGDPFPGSAGNMYFSTSTAPDSNLYNGDLSKISVTNIRSSSFIMTATFSINTFPINISAGPHGTITCTANPVAWNTNSTCTVKADTGHHIVNVTVDGALQQGFDPYEDFVKTFSAVKEPHSIGATFTINNYTLSTYVNTTGTGTPTVMNIPDQQTYDHGTVVTLMADADASTHFTNWSGDCSGTMNPLQVTMDAAKTCTANFEINKYAVGGTVTGLNGTVVLQNNGSNPQTITSVDNSFTFPAQNDGTAYNVTVQTQPTDQFCSVAQGSGNIAGANATTVLVVCVNTYTISATAEGGGSISCIPTIVLQNGSSDCSIRPSQVPFNQVLEVLVDGVSVGAKTSHQFTNIAGNHTIHAVFPVIACIWTYVDATHRETCVNSAAQLQQCLTEAEADGRHNTIMVVQGTYKGNFVYGTNENFDLSLYGGYTAGCECR